MKQKEIFIKIIVECCRLLLGVTFIFSGFVKAVDPVGGAIKISDYLVAFGLESFQSLSLIISFNLCAIEFMLGVCMLLGVYRKYNSLLVLLMMCFMTPLTLYLAIFDPVSDCGCFGDAIILTNWETFGKNVVLLAAAIFAFIHNQKIFPLYTYKVYWFVALFSFLACSGFAFQNYRHLPIIDFRPYKAGANIPELMSIPEGAPVDEYEYSFIYEKEGERRTFTLDNVPTDDSTWVFVDTETKLIREGYLPPVADFHLYNMEGDEVAKDILHDPDGVFLMIAPNLEKANDDRTDDINHLYDYSQEKGLTFYGVTASSEEAIGQWIDYTGAEYPFLQADDVLLKTIIRANPGVVLLKNGTILGKWNYRDIPVEEELKEVMDPYFGEETIIRKDERSLTSNLLTFALPLLLVWIYDYFRNRRKAKRLTTTKNV